MKAFKYYLLLSKLLGRPVLDDEFNTDRAAGAVNGTAAEPGPGTRVVVDTNGKLTIGSDKLDFATGGVQWGDPGLWYGLLTRTVGRAIVAKINPTGTGGAAVGFDNNQTISLQEGIRNNGSSLQALVPGAVTIGTITAGTPYLYGAVLRSAGAFLLMKGGTEFPDWTLVWIIPDGIGNRYPAITCISNASVFTCDYVHIFDLPAPWDTDYGIVTERLAGARSAGNTFTHEADCLIEWTQTALPSASSTGIRFRIQDASNYWEIRILSAGEFQLFEVIDTVATIRANGGAVIANGDRIVLVCENETIKGYSANTLRFTYSLAANFKTNTAGEINRLGTDGAVSDLLTWPRKPSGSALKLIKAAE